MIHVVYVAERIRHCFERTQPADQVIIRSPVQCTVRERLDLLHMSSTHLGGTECVAPRLW